MYIDDDKNKNNCSEEKNESNTSPKIVQEEKKQKKDHTESTITTELGGSTLFSAKNTPILSTKKIMIAYCDDSKLNHKMVPNLIKKNLPNAEFTLFENAQELLNWLEIQSNVKSIDMIILDHEMPGMSGEKACPLIRQAITNFGITKEDLPIAKFTDCTIPVEFVGSQFAIGKPIKVGELVKNQAFVEAIKNFEKKKEENVEKKDQEIPRV